MQVITQKLVFCKERTEAHAAKVEWLHDCWLAKAEPMM